MKTFADVVLIAKRESARMARVYPDLCHFMLTWSADTMQITASGKAESNRNIPRLLREMADQMEKDAGKKVTLS